MAIIEHLWVAEKVTVTGTGSITLPGTPFATGDRTFVSAYASGDQLPYVIRDGTTGAQEAGIGTVSISSGVATLARTVVIESSNANAAVNFAGNSCAVFVGKAPGVQSSAGAADAGKVPVLNAAGINDQSIVAYGPKLQSGDFATVLSGYAVNGVASVSPYSGRIVLEWVPVLYPQEFSGIGVVTQGAPSAAINVRLGLYDDAGTHHSPHNLIVDGGFISVSATGNNILTLPTNLFIKPPGVWVAVGVPSTTNSWSVWGYARQTTPGARGLPLASTGVGDFSSVGNPASAQFGLEDTSWGGSTLPNPETGFVYYGVPAIFCFLVAA